MIDRIEDLLLATLDAVSRFRVGQREAAGALLTQAKGRLRHGEWGDTGCTAWAWRRARRQRG